MKTKGACKTKWHDSLYVRCYQLAKTGASDTELAKLLGVNRATFFKWVAEKEALRAALAEARAGTSKSKVADREEGKSFLDYVYNRLSPELAKVWKLLASAERSKKHPESLLRDVTELDKMYLFFQALVHFNFNPSEACRAVCLSKQDLNYWIKSSPDFKKLYNEFHWHKKNFFEEKLVELVRRGNQEAVLFANKTLNRDRGYHEKLEVEYKGTVDHRVSISTLGLSVAEKVRLRDAIRAAKDAPKLLGGPKAVEEEPLDAEFEVKGVMK